ncbi:conserved hypothetical protein [Pseudomonas sp. IT-232MI5]
MELLEDELTKSFNVYHHISIKPIDDFLGERRCEISQGILPDFTSTYTLKVVVHIRKSRVSKQPVNDKNRISGFIRMY